MATERGLLWQRKGSKRNRLCWCCDVPLTKL